MKIFKLMALAAMALIAAASSYAQQKVSILGDSYSTFGGYMRPATNLSWYNGQDSNYNPAIDVKKVDQTWWWRMIEDEGYQLERNNSYSGSTICLTGYNGDDYSDRAFITRMLNIGDPDIILIFGGTNDSWAGSPIGEFKYSDWSKADLYAFRPAFAYMLSNLKEWYPDAQIYNMVNTGLSPEVTESMATICQYYDIPNIVLTDFSKKMGHPDIEGMASVAKQVGEAIKK